MGVGFGANGISAWVIMYLIRTSTIEHLEKTPSNIKKTPIIDSYIKELLVENGNNVTINHIEDLKIIHKKVIYIFGPLLRLW